MSENETELGRVALVDKIIAKFLDSLLSKGEEYEEIAERLRKVMLESEDTEITEESIANALFGGASND